MSSTKVSCPVCGTEMTPWQGKWGCKSCGTVIKKEYAYRRAGESKLRERLAIAEGARDLWKNKCEKIFERISAKQEIPEGFLESTDPSRSHIGVAKVAKFKKGDRVKYIPTHANGDPDHKDCECGVVSSVRGSTVFVKYDFPEMKMVTGDEDYTSKGTDVDYLVKL